MMPRAVFAALFSLVLLARASAEPLKDTTPHIALTGEAFEDAAPDQATLFVAVTTERATAAEAVSENARKAQSVIDELAAQGVEAKAVQNGAFTLASPPAKEVARLAPGKQVAKGFRARNEFSVEAQPVERAGAIAERLADAGEVEIRGVSFSLSDETARLEKLRALAIKDAERRAKTYVEAIGGKLGRVIEISPEADAPPGINPRVACLSEGKSLETESLLLRPQRQRLQSRVTVTWAVAR